MAIQTCHMTCNNRSVFPVPSCICVRRVKRRKKNRLAFGAAPFSPSRSQRQRRPFPHISVCHRQCFCGAFMVLRKADDAAAAVLKVRLEAVCSDKVQQMSAAIVGALTPPRPTQRSPAIGPLIAPPPHIFPSHRTCQSKKAAGSEWGRGGAFKARQKMLEKPSGVTQSVGRTS